MKTCPACSALNNADSKFCSACGGVLVPGSEATVDLILPKNASASPSISDLDSSPHGRFLPGTKIAGRYRIVSLAGRGGMGEVFLSHLHAALGENDLAFAALEQALVERECFLAWFPGQRSQVELMSSESDPRWPVFIEKVKAAVQAGASATI